MADTTTISEYMVTGMVCQHCVDAVTKEISVLEGVTGVQVDLAAGLVRVTSHTMVDDAAVRAAIDEAGYEVAE